jgi:hypothetical protein
VKYVKGNFLPTLTFRDLPDLNAQAHRWFLEEAGLRIHGTSRERPLERFAIELPLMQELPAIAPDLCSWHRVVLHRDCHVKFALSLYSAPFTLVGKTLWLRATEVSVSIFQDCRLVATHRRSRCPGERRTNPDHLPPETQAFFAHGRYWCLEQARRVGPSCTAVIEFLFSDRIVERLRGAQGVVGLAERYSDTRLEAACTCALAHGSPYYRTVKTILAGGFNLRPLDAHAAHPDLVYGRSVRFHRGAERLFSAEVAAAEHIRH